MSGTEAILEMRHIGKYFGANVVLRYVNFSVREGEVTCIIGASGSGKSTLLRCINLLEMPTSGEILYRGENILKPDMEEAPYRAKVGMVFQSFNLFQNMTVLDNCMAGQIHVARRSRETAREKAMYYLTKVGMEPYIHAKPGQLSGGQKKRVAIARALLAKPAILLADEPTGSLDSVTSMEVMGLLKICAEKFHQTVIIVTHQEEVAQMADRIIRIEDGRICKGSQNESIMDKSNAVCEQEVSYDR